MTGFPDVETSLEQIMDELGSGDCAEIHEADCVWQQMGDACDCRPLVVMRRERREGMS